jgi:hypothetical protein
MEGFFCINLYEVAAAVEMEGLGILVGSTSAGTSSKGVSAGQQVRQNSLLSVGIFGESTTPRSLLLALQSTKVTTDGIERYRTLFYELCQPYRLIDLVVRLEMLVVYFTPHRVNLNHSLRKET